MVVSPRQFECVCPPQNDSHRVCSKRWSTGPQHFVGVHQQGVRPLTLWLHSHSFVVVEGVSSNHEQLLYPHFSLTPIRPAITITKRLSLGFSRVVHDKNSMPGVEPGCSRLHGKLRRRNKSVLAPLRYAPKGRTDLFLRLRVE